MTLLRGLLQCVDFVFYGVGRSFGHSGVVAFLIFFLIVIPQSLCCLFFIVITVSLSHFAEPYPRGVVVPVLSPWHRHAVKHVFTMGVILGPSFAQKSLTNTAFFLPFLIALTTKLCIAYWLFQVNQTPDVTRIRNCRVSSMRRSFVGVYILRK